MRAKDIKQAVSDHTHEITSNLSKLVRIISIEDPLSASEGQPFGKGCNEALEFILDLAKGMGLRTFNNDGYGGFAEWGDGDAVVCAFTHLDVVPEGTGWRYPPFGGVVSDGRVYGRGTVDNKGPAITCLYALKVLKELGLESKSRMRIYFGCCEENGMKDLPKYLDRFGSPDLGFVPDSQFPLAYCERGVFFLRAYADAIASDQNIRLVSFEGGKARNMVPDYAYARLEAKNAIIIDRIISKFESYISTSNAKITIRQSGLVIELMSFGVTAHANMPEEGINAVTQLAKLLDVFDLNDRCGEIIRFIAQNIGDEINGGSLGIDLASETSSLTFNLSTLSIKGGIFEAVTNIRFPAEFTPEYIYEISQAAFKRLDIDLSIIDMLPAVLLDKESDYVQLLYKIYREITGRSESMKVAGATYAKYIENVVPFGAIFPGTIDYCHQVDESVSIQELILCCEIYSHALYRLSQLAGEKNQLESNS